MPLADILAKGYFPKELPNPFITTSFASAMTTAGVPLPRDFTPNLMNKKTKLLYAKHVKYSHARGGLLRRLLSLPNPLLFYPLCYEIDNNWAALQSNIGGTAFSATNPTFSSIGRAIQGARPLSSRKILSLKTRLNSRYILKTDISRFYHSIYTHSIPWALH